MITVPTYLLVGQVALLALACFVLASAYRRLGRPINDGHSHGPDEDATRLVGTALPDLGNMSTADGSTAPPPRRPGPGRAALLVYVLPGCETCQTALERLQPLLERAEPKPDVHLISVGTDSGVDAYRRFGLPLWRAELNLSDIFGLKVYPVFLAVDDKGMIRAAGSTHDPDALRAYLAPGSVVTPTSPPPHHVTITSKP